MEDAEREGKRSAAGSVKQSVAGSAMAGPGGKPVLGSVRNAAPTNSIRNAVGSQRKAPTGS